VGIKTSTSANLVHRAFASWPRSIRGITWARVCGVVVVTALAYAVTSSFVLSGLMLIAGLVAYVGTRVEPDDQVQRRRLNRSLEVAQDANDLRAELQLEAQLEVLDQH